MFRALNREYWIAPLRQLRRKRRFQAQRKSKGWWTAAPLYSEHERKTVSSRPTIYSEIVLHAAIIGLLRNERGEEERAKKSVSRSAKADVLQD